MGLGSYFKAKKPESSMPSISEKVEAPVESPVETGTQSPNVLSGSSRNSLSGRSVGSSAFMDDIKHEVMVNYLYQQQCSRLWVSDGSGELEGVLLRKSRNVYLSCPPPLVNSLFAASCAAMNVHVSYQL